MNKKNLIEGNLADVTLELDKKFEEWQVVLARTEGLFNLIVNNTSASIISVDENSNIILKNFAADRLIAEIGLKTLTELLAEYNDDGMFDISLLKRFFHITVNKISKESDIGFVYIIEDVTQIKLNEAARLRNEKLQLMGEMAANIAHEIRNPLGAIELFATLLARDLEGDDGKKGVATSIVKGVRSINNVISNTLLFTKEMVVEKKEHILSDLVDNVVLYLQHIIRDKGITVINKLTESSKIDCDEDMFKQVVMNILNNACDAVKESGVIKLSSHYDDNNLYFVIEDNGVGIDKDMTPRLFMPFQTTKASGTGLGLSIAYKIIKAHGGDIVAENIVKGSRFTIITPIDRKI